MCDSASSCSEDYFMIGMLLNNSATSTSIDKETTKLASEYFEVYIKNDKVVLVVDKRYMPKPRMYNDIKTAYDAIYS